MGLRKFLNDENGAVTVEFVLWVPVFLMLIAAAVDLSTLFMNQSNLWHVTRDAARIVSRHGMTPAEAETYLKNNGTISSFIADPANDVDVSLDSSNLYVTASVDATLTELDVFGFFNFTPNFVINASVTLAMEPR